MNTWNGPVQGRLAEQTRSQKQSKTRRLFLASRKNHSGRRAKKRWYKISAIFHQGKFLLWAYLRWVAYHPSDSSQENYDLFPLFCSSNSGRIESSFSVQRTYPQWILSEKSNYFRPHCGCWHNDPLENTDYWKLRHNTNTSYFLLFMRWSRLRRLIFKMRGNARSKYLQRLQKYLKYKRRKTRRRQHSGFLNRYDFAYAGRDTVN